jgi:hypothetical protein
MAMQIACVGRKALALGGFVIAFCGLVWLLPLPTAEFDIAGRLGQVCANLATMAVVAYLWAHMAAHLGRRGNWSGNGCFYAGFSLVVPLAIAALMIHRFSDSGLFVVNASLLAGILCRKIVHPDWDSERTFASAEFRSLFPK